MGITALPEQFSGLSASEVSLDGGFEPNRSQEIDSGQKAIWLKNWLPVALDESPKVTWQLFEATSLGPWNAPAEGTRQKFSLLVDQCQVIFMQTNCDLRRKIIW